MAANLSILSRVLFTISVRHYREVLVPIEKSIGIQVGIPRAGILFNSPIQEFKLKFQPRNDSADSLNDNSQRTMFNGSLANLLRSKKVSLGNITLD